MNKELEAIIRKELEKITYTHYEPKRTEDINNAMNIIKQYLAPPTKEEVCQALSEYLNEPVWFDDKGNIRITTQWVTQQIYLKGKYIGINIQVVLPPRLITLIGKFYENEVEKE
jgi:hypothetical protein